MVRKLRWGVGAQIKCATRFLHPSQHIRARHPNPQKGHVTENMVLVRLEEKNVNRKQQLVVVMIHPDYPEVELYAVQRYCHITTEGPEDQLYEQPAPNVANNNDEEQQGEQMLPSEVAQMQANLTAISDDDVNIARGLVETDDDNLPAPENQPQAGSAAENIMGEWSDNGTCPRKMAGARDTNAAINFPFGLTPSLVHLFEMFFMKTFLKDVILSNINTKIKGDVVTYGEFLRWIGMWFLMATIQGPQRRDFWATSPIDIYDGAPFRLNGIMSRNRFETILKAISYTSSTPPTYTDRFHEVRDMIEAWNANMVQNFTPSWISCLDESMSVWINQYTCPGFMFVPRKPWPFGNEYHTVCCGLSGIMWGIELVEGKDAPRERPKPPYENLGKTVGLLLRMLTPIYHTGKVVVLDSGFCVVKGIVELLKQGVFAAALIKKRRYWPRYVRGDEIRQHFDSKAVGDADAWSGTLDGQSFKIHSMKEPDYVMSLMTTYGTLSRVGCKVTSRKVGNETITFNYPEVVNNHFKYRHAVDDHNSKRHQPISLESTWATTWWPNRVFAFLLAITEVNVMLAAVHFTEMYDTQPSMLDFRKKFAKELINNQYWRDEEHRTRSSPRKRRRSHESGCKLLSLAKFKKFRGTQIVAAESAYPQAKCTYECGKKVRTYCQCTPGRIVCSGCYPLHCKEVE